MQISVDMYKHHLEDDCLNDMKKRLFLHDTLLDYYNNYVEAAIMPDLIGKTVKVTKKQFGVIYEMVAEMSEMIDIDEPDVYVFENYYYDANAEGLTKPWIQISAKTIADFTNEELRFLLGKQLAHIKSDHLRWEVLMEQCLNSTDLLNNVPGVGIANMIGAIEGLQSTLKIVMYRWNRITEYSSDACGYLLCNDLDASINAIKKMVLNNTMLAQELNLKDYLNQTQDLDRLDSVMASYSKLDELMPYGPYRIKELIRYASSTRSKEAIKLLHSSVEQAI